jgi:hypothetical protein
MAVTYDLKIKVINLAVDLAGGEFPPLPPISDSCKNVVILVGSYYLSQLTRLTKEILEHPTHKKGTLPSVTER